MAITHDTPATVFGVRSKEGLAGLAGTTHACQERDGSALCFEVSDQDYRFTFFVFCTTRLVRFVALDKKTVRVQVELDLRTDMAVHFSGGEQYGDRIGAEGPPPVSRSLVLV